MRTGRNIRAIRKQKGLTLDGLSALCGIHRDELGLYERGQMTPRTRTVEKIASALEVPIVAIREGMGWTAQEPVEPWETREGAPLREGILQAVRESRGENFTPCEADVRLLMESVKAAIPALVEHMKDTRPEAEIHRGILKELELPGGEEPVQCALTDAQWEQIRPLLPPERGGKGRAFKSNRLMLEGILYHMKSGTAWKELPERFGRYQCVSSRLRLWQTAGVWDTVLDRLAQLGVVDTKE